MIYAAAVFVLAVGVVGWVVLLSDAGVIDMTPGDVGCDGVGKPIREEEWDCNGGEGGGT